MEDEIWRPGVIANPLLLGSFSDYLDAFPNYWAPLYDNSSGEPAQLHEPPPTSTKPLNSIIKTSTSFIHGLLSLFQMTPTSVLDSGATSICQTIACYHQNFIIIHS